MVLPLQRILKDCKELNRLNLKELHLKLSYVVTEYQLVLERININLYSSL
jgi:hypothetical protein